MSTTPILLVSASICHSSVASLPPMFWEPCWYWYGVYPFDVASIASRSQLSGFASLIPLTLKNALLLVRGVNHQIEDKVKTDFSLYIYIYIYI